MQEMTASVLVVDDHEQARASIADILRHAGHAVTCAASAAEALAKLETASPDVILTDLQMPGLSGVDLQDHLIARGHRIPIIFITGYPDENVRARAMKAGAVAFLSKPVNPDHLLGYLEKALKAA